MSYILEALKKSQKERELGQVPTLADVPHLPGEKSGKGAYWSIVAVTLAMLATLIALYAAFGERLLSAGDPSSSELETTAESAPELRPATPASAPVSTAPVVAATAHDVPRPEERPKPAPATPAAAAAASENGRRTESPAKPSPTTEKTAKPAAPPAPPVATAPVAAPRLTPRRQLPSDTPNVPPELLQDVRRFEEQVRKQERMDARQVKAPPPTAAPPVQPPEPVARDPEPTPAEKPARKVQAPPAPQPSRVTPPRLSELPMDLQQSIPKHRLTVHVFSAAPERRFVIINSRKMRTGERSREGLLLEEITPDGVVLEYQGHRFSRHR